MCVNGSPDRNEFFEAVVGLRFNCLAADGSTRLLRLVLAGGEKQSAATCDCDSNSIHRCGLSSMLRDCLNVTRRTKLMSGARDESPALAMSGGSECGDTGRD